MRRIHQSSSGIALVTGLIALAAAACSPGSVADDDGDLPAAALCNADLTMGGSFQTSVEPPPAATDGCMPMGTWTVQPLVATMGDCAAVDVSSQYLVDVTGEGRDRTITLRDPPAGAEVTTNVHSGGNAECEMSLEIISDAGAGQYHVLLLRPYTDPAATPILGSGSYQLWSKHP